MPRFLGQQINTLRLFDNLNDGETIELYYRNPTTKERQKYTDYAVVRKRNQTEFRVTEAQRIFGAKILTGIREGDFLIPGEDGQPVPLSSDPKSEHYREDWKDMLIEYASDIVTFVGSQVFDRSVEADTVPDAGEPVAEDLEKN